MLPESVSLQSIVTASPAQISSAVGDEAVILDTKRGVYHGLDPTGARIWELIQQRGHTVAELRDAILAEYDVEPERCERDILALVHALADKGLIDVSDA